MTVPKRRVPALLLGNVSQKCSCAVLETPEAVKKGRVQAAYEQHQARIRALDENEG